MFSSDKRKEINETLARWKQASGLTGSSVEEHETGTEMAALLQDIADPHRFIVIEVGSEAVSFAPEYLGRFVHQAIAAATYATRGEGALVRAYLTALCTSIESDPALTKIANAIIDASEGKCTPS